MTRMIQRRMFALAALALCAASCGGKGPFAGGGCSISFSGAFSGTYACTTSATYNQGANSGIIAIVINPGGPLKFYNFNVRTASGDLRVGTYAPDAFSYSSTVLDLTNGQYFAEDSAPSSNGTGTFSLKVASLDVVATTSGNKVYAIHGTLDETVVETFPATSGQIVAHASF